MKTQSGGGSQSLVRILAALEGFYMRHGHWTTRVRVFPGFIRSIKDQELPDMLKGLPSTVKFCLGEHPPEIFREADLIVVSPGVPLDIRHLLDARGKGKRIIGELELAYDIVQSSKFKSQGREGRVPFIAIRQQREVDNNDACRSYSSERAGKGTFWPGTSARHLRKRYLR